MNMLRKILNIIGAFGGIVFIVQAIAGLCFPEMLKWYYRRREIGLSATTEKKVYVSKAKFDREFAMYQELSSKALSLVYKIGEIVLRVKLNDKEKTYEQLLQEVTDLDNDAVRIPVKRSARSGGTVRPFQRKRRSRSILNGVKRRPSVLSDQRSQFLTELRPLVS